MTKKLTTEEFIQKARNTHGDLYDYSKVEYVNNITKVIITHPEYGDFEQLPTNHIKGCHCPALKGGVKFTCEKFIEKARIVHGNLYDYSKVEYINSKTKIIIIDPEFGEFLQTPEKHLIGQGNPIRKIIKISDKLKMTNEEFIEKSIKIFGDIHDYSKMIYKNNNTQIILIDKLYGEYEIRPTNHLQHKNCHPLRNKNIKQDKEVDHIIPISIICSSKERKSNSSFLRNRPLFKFLNSDINKRFIDRLENNIKKDSIYINGKKHKARNFRNNYDIIYQLALDELNIDIFYIIEQDKNYIQEEKPCQ